MRAPERIINCLDCGLSTTHQYKLTFSAMCDFFLLECSDRTEDRFQTRLCGSDGHAFYSSQSCIVIGPSNVCHLKQSIPQTLTFEWVFLISKTVWTAKLKMVSHASGKFFVTPCRRGYKILGDKQTNFVIFSNFISENYRIFWWDFVGRIMTCFGICF